MDYDGLFAKKGGESNKKTRTLYRETNKTARQYRRS